MDGEIVATATSKWGGDCADCAVYIRKGAPIFKISQPGTTTKHGQGPGRWVCMTCQEKYVRGQDAHLITEGEAGWS